MLLTSKILQQCLFKDCWQHFSPSRKPFRSMVQIYCVFLPSPTPQHPFTGMNGNIMENCACLIYINLPVSFPFYHICIFEFDLLVLFWFYKEKKCFPQQNHLASFPVPQQLYVYSNKASPVVFRVVLLHWWSQNSTGVMEKLHYGLLSSLKFPRWKKNAYYCHFDTALFFFCD